MNETRYSSKVYDFVGMVWNNANKAKGHSWTTLNSGLRTALCVAIESGFKFEREDFERMADYRIHYWAYQDNDHNWGEGFYSRAVKSRNMSACLSFEQWKQRKPFIVNGNRLYLGAEFYLCEPEWWNAPKGKVWRVWVTSFAADGDGFTACWYDNPGQWNEGKPKKIFKLSLAEFKQGIKDGLIFGSHDDAEQWYSAKIETEKAA